MAEPRSYVVHICRKCGEQQWFAGSCGELGCDGRVVSYVALLKKDIESFAEEQQEAASPVPRVFIERFVESLFRRFSSPRSG